MWHFPWYIYTPAAIAVVLIICGLAVWLQPTVARDWQSAELESIDNILDSMPFVVAGALVLAVTVVIQYSSDSSHLTHRYWQAARPWQASTHIAIVALDARAKSFSYVAAGSTTLCHGGIIKPQAGDIKFYTNPAC